MKRLLALMMTAVLLVAMLGGCSSTTPPASADATTAPSQTTKAEATIAPTEDRLAYLNLSDTYPIIKDGYNETLKIISVTNKLVDPADHWIWKFFKQNANLNTDVTYYDATGWGEQKNLIFASKDLPDMFYQCAFSRDEIVQYGQVEGMFYNIAGLIEQYAPLIQTAIVQDPSVVSSCTTPDGKMYTLPTIDNSDEYPKSAPRYFIHQTWLDKLGLKNPETLDQLTEVLKAIKTEDPNGNGEADEIPLVSTYSNGYSLSAMLLTAMGMNVGNTSSPFIKSNGKIGLAFMEGNYVKYLDYVKMLLDEGLLDQDYFTMTSDQAVAKMTSNIVGLAKMSAPFVEAPDNYKEYVSLNPLTSDVSSEKMMPIGDYISVGQLAVAYDTEYPELCMRFANTHFTTDAAILFWTGQYEGQPYAIVDGYGVTTMKKLDDGTGEVVYPTGDMGVWDFLLAKVRPYYGSMQIGYGKYTELCPTLFGMERTMSDVEKTWRDSFAATVQPYVKQSMPDLYYTPEDLDRKTALETPIMDYLKVMESKYIMGTESTADMTAFNTQMKSLGVEEYLQIIQKAYDSYKSSLK